jgi:ABC-type branched-subunit amino acid transport system substrate-binding protein
MTHKRKTAVALAAAASLALAACGSSSKGASNPPASNSPSAAGGSGASSSAPAGGGNGTTITVGVLADFTGPAASGNKTVTDGIKAGVVYANRNGYKVKYVLADTATNPATALSAAQKLVTQDHVSVVIAHSAITFAASTYLTSHKVPVIGAGEDGPEWTKATNMFAVYGALHTTKVTDTLGQFFKLQGVTTVGAVGYSISPLSSESAKAAVASGVAVGLKKGYLNASFAFGSTDVGPVVLGMKSAGVDGFTASTDPNTAFALVTGLRQAGAKIKVATFPTGYGGDLAQAGPGALNAAQGVYFSLGYEPIEMQTAATKQFVADLTAAGVNGAPTYAMYNGYVSIGLLVRALKADGNSIKQADITTALSGIHDWDALGLFGGRKLDINDRDTLAGGVDNCSWFTKLVNNKFELVPNADPICGKTLSVTVSASS